MNQHLAADPLETTLGRVLRAGVVASTVSLTAGVIAAFSLGAGPLTTFLLTAGIVMLIATPVARVVISCLAYFRRRDWTFALLTLIVLVELVASIVAAILK
jgi:uncharacterized membrane protein